MFDPTDERVIASIPAASEADVEEVLSSARRAQAEWARTPAARRGAYLREMVDLIEDNSERLAELVCEEVGKLPLELCTSAERVLVHTEVVEEFTDRYVAAAQAIKVGSPRESSDMGPLVSKAQLEKKTAALESAINDGATIVTGGGRPDGDAFQRGYWYAPTVLRDIRPEIVSCTTRRSGRSRRSSRSTRSTRR